MCSNSFVNVSHACRPVKKAKMHANSSMQVEDDVVVYCVSSPPFSVTKDFLLRKKGSLSLSIFFR